MRRSRVFFAVLTIVSALHAQDWISRHREDEARWARKTGVPPSVVHRLWRASSHFADEQEDDSEIELPDTTSFAERNQVLLVTSAGEPRCLTLTVFSTGARFLKVWSADQTPDGNGFCDNLSIPVRLTVGKDRIEIAVPRERLSPRSSHVEVEHYHYRWTGKSYSVGAGVAEFGTRSLAVRIGGSLRAVEPYTLTAPATAPSRQTRARRLFCR